jgi:hypothetical protein
MQRSYTQQLYQEIWTSMCVARRRRRRAAALIGALLCIVCAFGLALHSLALAMFGAAGGITLLWMLQQRWLDGDPVALCLQLMYEYQPSRIELAALDAQSHGRAPHSEIDRAMQRALATYRIVNRRQLQSR